MHISVNLHICTADDHDLDIANDVGRSSHGIVRVKKTLAGAYEVLSATMCLRASKLTANESKRQYTSPDNRHSSSAMSILGTVMGMTDEVCHQFFQPSSLLLTLTTPGYQTSTNDSRTSQKRDTSPNIRCSTTCRLASSFAITISARLFPKAQSRTTPF